MPIILTLWYRDRTRDYIWCVYSTVDVLGVFLTLFPGMLTFMTYYLLKNPEAMRKLREEIDTKIGDRPMTVHDVGKLPYLLGKSKDNVQRRKF